uniref:Integrase catalytic domain-containing protein n=1 Tax=Strongyloides venezuelensis TaxID=75913 RepID=A0A0K0G425_STRVS
MNTQNWTTIKGYNPAEDNIKSYLQRLNLFFDMDNITEERRKCIATLTKMPASLLNELEQLPQTENQELKNNFINLRDYLHKVYGADKAQKNAQLRLRTFRIREQPKYIAEDLRQYEQLLRATHTGSVDELLNRFKSHLLDKLRNDNLFNKLLNTTYETITEMILDIESTMLLYQNRNQSPRKSSKTFQYQNNFKTTRNQKVFCTWCQKPNHKEDVCRYKASGKQKVESRCTSNLTQSTKTDKVDTFMTDSKSPNRKLIGKAYKIQITLNDQPILARIDSGARTTIISQDTEDKYHIQYDSNKDNVFPNMTTKMSPYELLFGRKPHLACSPPTPPVAQIDINPNIATSYYLLQEGWKLASDISMKIREQANQKLQNAEKSITIYEPGDKVIIYRPNAASKISTNFTGPYTVKYQEGKIVYLTKSTRGTPKMVHVHDVKPFIDRERSSKTSEKVSSDVPITKQY